MAKSRKSSTSKVKGIEQLKNPVDEDFIIAMLNCNFSKEAIAEHSTEILQQLWYELQQDYCHITPIFD